MLVLEVACEALNFFGPGSNPGHPTTGRLHL